MRTALTVLALLALAAGLGAAGFLGGVYPAGMVGVGVGAAALLTSWIGAAGLLALVRICSHLGAIRKLLARQAAGGEAKAPATGDAELDAFLRRPVRLPRLGRRAEKKGAA